MVAGTWWFFTLIMVSSYTANLAAFLTVESLASPFKTIEELANQNVIKFGAKKGGATSNFFRVRNDLQKLFFFTKNLFIEFNLLHISKNLDIYGTTSRRNDAFQS